LTAALRKIDNVNKKDVEDVKLGAVDVAVVSYGKWSTFRRSKNDAFYKEAVDSVVADLEGMGYSKENMILYGHSKGAYVAGMAAGFVGIKTLAMDQLVRSADAARKGFGRWADSRIARLVKTGSALDVKNIPAPDADAHVTFRQSGNDCLVREEEREEIRETIRNWARTLNVSPVALKDDDVHLPKAYPAAMLIAVAVAAGNKEKLKTCTWEELHTDEGVKEFNQDWSKNWEEIFKKFCYKESKIQLEKSSNAGRSL
jgi:hypothetical protein